MKNSTFTIIMFFVCVVGGYLFSRQLDSLSSTQSILVTVAAGVVGLIIG